MNESLFFYQSVCAVGEVSLQCNAFKVRDRVVRFVEVSGYACIYIYILMKTYIYISIKHIECFFNCHGLLSIFFLGSYCQLVFL